MKNLILHARMSASLFRARGLAVSTVGFELEPSASKNRERNKRAVAKLLAKAR